MRRTVNVERLEVRMRGVSPVAAREAARGLARELLEELARGGGVPRDARGGHARVARVVANVSGEEAGAGEDRGLPRALARRVADAVRARAK